MGRRWCNPSEYRELLAAVIERDGVCCHWCGEKTKLGGRDQSPFRRSLDHLTPRSRGGTNDVDNLVLAHRRCNYLRDCGRLPNAGAGKISAMELSALFASGAIQGR